VPYAVGLPAFLFDRSQELFFARVQVCFDEFGALMGIATEIFRYPVFQRDAVLRPAEKITVLPSSKSFFER